jgi:hypothetical protein
MNPYTEQIHAQGLIEMFETNCCGRCPSGYSEIAEEDAILEHLCPVCRVFIGLNYTEGGYNACPCHEWGPSKHGKSIAIRTTWLALEAKGYLE